VLQQLAAAVLKLKVANDQVALVAKLFGATSLDRSPSSVTPRAASKRVRTDASVNRAHRLQWLGAEVRGEAARLQLQLASRSCRAC
jgi:hypothetical protein